MEKLNTLEAPQVKGTTVTLAVLPFENLTEDNSLALFCQSFSIELITELSKFRQFQIIAYQSVKDLRPDGSDDKNFSRLQTDYFIQGSFRSEKNHIRINVQLYDSHTHRLVWADRFGGKISDLQDIQENLYNALVTSLQRQMNNDLLSQIRKKPRVKLKAYECWLYGLDELKKGSPESDLKAREYFQHAIEIQPDYSLAYSGVSLSYFNEWSCQLWDRWEVSQSGAFEWAKKAMELDDQNYVAAYVIGRLFLFDGAYESAEYYLRKSLRLNPNDPESLIVIASCFTYLELHEEAYELYKKAIRLNPANAEAYYPIGGFVFFEMGEYEKAIELAIQTHTSRWVDAEAIFAAAWYHVGNFKKMEECWQKYLRSYRAMISRNEDSDSGEALEWMIKVNPFKGKTNLEPFWKYISKGNCPDIHETKNETPPVETAPNIFLKEAGIWKFSYEGKTIQMAEVKGFWDIQKLLASPGESIHCAEMMGSVLHSEGEALLDEKAKQTYRKEILELQQEITAAEEDNDYGRAEMLREKYDQIIEHLSQSLGLKGKSRQTGSPVEKARSAVTWRIRSAIVKIEKEYPALGKHLSNAIKTGTFCTYTPEQENQWITS